MVQVLYSIVYNNVHNFRLIIYFCTMIFLFQSVYYLCVHSLKERELLYLFSVFTLYVQLGGKL